MARSIHMHHGLNNESRNNPNEEECGYHSPPRRGGVARQLNRSWRTGVARSASPIRRSLNRSSAKRLAELTTPSAPSLRSAHPPLLCEEGNASLIPCSVSTDAQEA